MYIDMLIMIQNICCNNLLTRGVYLMYDIYNSCTVYCSLSLLYQLTCNAAAFISTSLFSNIQYQGAWDCDVFKDTDGSHWIGTQLAAAGIIGRRLLAKGVQENITAERAQHIVWTKKYELKVSSMSSDKHYNCHAAMQSFDIGHIQ